MIAPGQQFHSHNISFVHFIRVFDDVIIEHMHILEGFEVMRNLIRDNIPKVSKSSLLTG